MARNSSIALELHYGYGDKLMGITGWDAMMIAGTVASDMASTMSILL